MAIGTLDEQVRIEDEGKYWVFCNIRCVDAKRTVFEEYPKLYVAKEIEQRQFTLSSRRHQPYDLIKECESNGEFLPSMALSCNLLAALYSAAVEKKEESYVTKHPALKGLLDQYKNGHLNLYIQNTLVQRDFGGQIIHYPCAKDFLERTAINEQETRVCIYRQREGIPVETILVADALKNHGMRDFIRNFTGLANPSILVEMGEYFGKRPNLEGCAFKNYIRFGNNNLGLTLKERTVTDARGRINSYYANGPLTIATTFPASSRQRVRLGNRDYPVLASLRPPLREDECSLEID